jgi:hypothetical protein
VSSFEQKSLDLSIQVYRQLLGIYPQKFLEQFGDQLLQTFGDLARRAMNSGGYVPLLLLWSRMLPDAVFSAIREHVGATSRFPVSRLRLRWILACGFGFEIGALVATQLRWWGATHSRWALLCIGFALGWMQWVWALRRRPSEGLAWMAASAAGLILSTQAFLYAIDEMTWGINPLIDLNPLGDWGFSLASGFGIGLFQFFVLRRLGARSWTWIPANVLGFLAGRYYAVLALNAFVLGNFNRPYIRPEFLFRITSDYPSIISPELTIAIAPFVTGAVVGYFTSLPLESVLCRNEKVPVGEAVQS